MARLVLPALVALVLASAPVLAQQAPADPAPPAVAGAAADTPEVVTPEAPRTCLQTTGSRVTAAQNARAEREGKPTRRCAAAAGRVYTADDLARSGHTNIADALRSLDTGIR